MFWSSNKKKGDKDVNKSGSTKTVARKTSSADGASAPPQTDARLFNASNLNMNYKPIHPSHGMYRSFQDRVTPTRSTLEESPSVLQSKRYSQFSLTNLKSIKQPSIDQVTTIGSGRLSGPVKMMDVLPTYINKSKKRGKCLIINNIMFKGNAERRGAEFDHKRLEKVLKDLKFEVNVKSNLNKKEMLHAILKFSTQSFYDVDMSIVVVMSHGTGNCSLGNYTEIFGIDEEGLSTNEIVDCFKTCRELFGKPKIFIFQCCRGDDQEFILTDSVKRPSTENGDVLIAYSSLPGFVSHRDPLSGTWYIQTLCDVIREFAHQYDLEDILKIVGAKLSTIYPGMKQTPAYENRGFKRCKLV